MNSGNRIVLLSEDYPPYPGGVAQWAAGVAQALSDRGEAVELVTRFRADYPEVVAKDFPIGFIHGRHWKRFRTWYCFRWVRTYLSENGELPGAVVATTWNMARGIAPILKKKGIPLIVVVHGLEITRRMSFIKRWVLRATLRNAQSVIAVSKFTARHAREVVPGIPVPVAPNGVDSERFHPGIQTDTLRGRLGIGHDRVILTLARVIERKGHDMVIRALPRILAACPEATYVICGPYEQEWYNKLLSLATSLGVEKKVLFSSYVPSEDIPRYYALGDIYVMPSRELGGKGDTEGFGITYLEANACGKPVIGGKSGGVADAIEDGVTGFLVDPSNPQEIADRAIELLTDSDKAFRMGSAGRKRVENHFTWKSAADCVLASLSSSR